HLHFGPLQLYNKNFQPQPKPKQILTKPPGQLINQPTNHPTSGIMKIQVVVVLLFALSATEICEALNFFQKHVVPQMAPGDCNTKMKAEDLILLAPVYLEKALHSFWFRRSSFRCNFSATENTILVVIASRLGPLQLNQLTQRTMRILFVCLLACLLLLQVVSSQPENKAGKSTPRDKPVEEDRYEKFRRQHINETMDENSCDSEIRRKKIYKNNSCKKTNTFILADENSVKSICQGEKNKNKMTRSKQKFRIVVCKLKKPARKPNCEYEGTKLTKRIVVKCQNGLPVHFDGDILNFGN
ncbi:hypothetical protein ILYODFUR_025260, partial [Ilyodon furcidens]